MRAGWALLRRRDFGLLWAGGLISETGDWFLLVGLPVWVFKVTGSSLVTATVFLVGLLPSLVVGPLAGVLVDRWDRRRTLVAVSLAEAVFLLPLLAVDGPDRLWIVYLVMAVEASLGQLNDPARNALVPSLVSRDDLVAANALIGLNSNLARLVGSPLGGVLVELAGLPGLVIGDAISFLVGAALLGLMRPSAKAPSGPRVNAPSPSEGPRRGSVAQLGSEGRGSCPQPLSRDGAGVGGRAAGGGRRPWPAVGAGGERDGRGRPGGLHRVVRAVRDQGAGRGRGPGGAAAGGAGDRRAARRRWWWSGWPGGWNRGGCWGCAWWCSPWSTWPSGTGRW